MTVLYNMRHAGDEYRCTKFNSDFDVESSYTLSLEECTCPAGHRPMCRHREMLPKFIARDHIGDNWLFDYDRGGWVQGIPSEAIIAEADENIRDLTFAIENPDCGAAAILPAGITVIDLENPATAHNAIADALGEPRVAPTPTIRRRV